MDPRAPAAGRVRLGARVHGLLEQGHARLVPQALAQQQRRVDGGGQDRRRDGLRQVVHARKLLGLDLKVDLEARVARFEHHVVVVDLELVEPLDAHVDVAAAHVHERVVEGAVARHRRHVVQGEVGAPQGGQDAREHDAGVAAGGDGLDLGHQPAQLGLELGQAAPAEHARARVDLEVVARKLGRDARLLEARHELRRHGPRVQVVADQKQLLLGADATHTALEPVLVEHALQGTHVVEQRLHEGA